MTRLNFDVPDPIGRRFKSFAALQGVQYPVALERLLDIADKQDGVPGGMNPAPQQVFSHKFALPLIFAGMRPAGTPTNTKRNE